MSSNQGENMSQEIGKTILEQIKAYAPAPVIWSWGASKWQLILESQITGTGEEYLGGLLFYVRGHHHTGHVLVTLAGNDTYTVSFGHVRKGKINVKQQFKGIHCDELARTIDDTVERIPQYA
jgi:hypothetical protein